MVLVEGLAVGVHELVAGPGFRDQHHHGVAQAVAALEQELERVIEARRVRLAFVGDRPQLRDVVAEQLGIDGRLARRHPVVVAAHGVDLAVMRDHTIGMRQLPRREGVGREALVDEDQRRFEARIVEVLVIGLDLVGQEHALVDDGARRQRHAIGADVLVVVLGIDAARYHLAQQVEPGLIFLVVRNVGRAADEHLAMERLGRDDLRRLRQRRIVDRHIAEAEQRQAFGLRRFGDDVLDMGAKCCVLRHEPVADAVLAGRRQFDALGRHFLAQEPVRNLHQHAGAVADQRIGADGAAMGEVFQHRQTVFDDLMRLHTLHVGDEADAAGIVLVARIVEPLRGQAGGRAIGRASRIFDDCRFRLRGLAVDRRWRQFRHRPILRSAPFGGDFPQGAGLPWEAQCFPLILAARLAKFLPNHSAIRPVRIRYRTGQSGAVYPPLATMAGMAAMIRQSSLFCATK